MCNTTVCSPVRPSARQCERREQIMDEESSIQRRLAAILAADIAGYSRLMHEDEPATVRDLKAHQSVILPLIGGHGGRGIDTTRGGSKCGVSPALRGTAGAGERQNTGCARNHRAR